MRFERPIQSVRPMIFRVPHPLLPEHALWEDVVHLWQVVLVCRRVIEVAVPEIKQQVDRVRAVTRLPESLLSKF